jgi:hypothetical protein
MKRFLKDTENAQCNPQTLNNALEPLLKRQAFSNATYPLHAAERKNILNLFLQIAWFKTALCREHITINILCKVRKRCRVEVLLLKYLHKIYLSNL